MSLAMRRCVGVYRENYCWPTATSWESHCLTTACSQALMPLKGRLCWFVGKWIKQHVCYLNGFCRISVFIVIQISTDDKILESSYIFVSVCVVLMKPCRPWAALLVGTQTTCLTCLWRWGVTSTSMLEHCCWSWLRTVNRPGDLSLTWLHCATCWHTRYWHKPACILLGTTQTRDYSWEKSLTRITLSVLSPPTRFKDQSLK